MDRQGRSIDVFSLDIVIKALIVHPEVSLTIKDKNNETALDYILKYDFYTLTTLKVGKLSPTSVIYQPGSLLLYSVKNNFLHTFQYLLSDEAKFDINKEDSEFMCLLIKNKNYHFDTDWIHPLLHSSKLTPFRALNKTMTLDECKRVHIYNENVIKALLMNISRDGATLFANFLTHSNSLAFVRDTECYQRIEPLVKENSVMRNMYACRKLLDNAEQSLLINEFKSAVSSFQEAHSLNAEVFQNFILEKTNEIFSGKSSFSKEQQVHFIECITKYDYYHFELNRMLKLFHEGHNNILKPNLLLAEYFLKNESKLAIHEQSKLNLYMQDFKSLT